MLPGWQPRNLALSCIIGWACPPGWSAWPEKKKRRSLWMRWSQTSLHGTTDSHSRSGLFPSARTSDHSGVFFPENTTPPGMCFLKPLFCRSFRFDHSRAALAVLTVTASGLSGRCCAAPNCLCECTYSLLMAADTPTPLAWAEDHPRVLLISFTPHIVLEFMVSNSPS